MIEKRSRRPACRTHGSFGVQLHQRYSDWRMLLLLCLCALMLAVRHGLPGPSAGLVLNADPGIMLAAAPSAASAVLECFQVTQPVIGSRSCQSDLCRPSEKHKAPSCCSVPLMDHVFAWSYGRPFVGMLDSLAENLIVTGAL